MVARNGVRGTLLATALAVAASPLVVAAPAEAFRDESPAGTTIRWSPCYKELGPDFECATVPVPLDHDQPNGPAIQLAVVRLPATDTARRIGSLFLNPGGPGASGVDFALFFGPFADTVYGPEVRARFDIVGFDPRGVQRSTGIRCFGNERQAEQVFPPISFPLTAEEEALFQMADGLLADQCDRRANKVAPHISTANVARDLDLLRGLVGDERLNYLGLSYGSYLGVTYANLFPDRVRALAIDGVLDPIAWSNVEGAIPFTTRLRSDHGAQATLDRFFELCDAAPADCAMAPNSAERFAALVDRLRVDPVPIFIPEIGEEVLVGYHDAIELTLNVLYDPFAYSFLADLLAQLEQAASPAQIGAAFGRLAQATPFVNKRGFPNYVNFAEAFPSVACSDSNNPDDYAVWSREGADADAEFGYFGRFWTWASSACAQWPIADEDRYTGPFDANTASPVLAVSPLYDPATRVEGAQTVRGLLPNSALLTVDAPGHTALGAASACGGALVGQYLLDPQTAAPLIDGFTCPPEFNPFELEEVASAAGMPPDVRAAVLENVAYRPFR